MTPMTPTDEFDPRTYAIIGAAQEVHSVMGCGYLERGYQLALANEMRRRAIPFHAELELPLIYKGDLLDCTYRLDFLCFDDVVVELKALHDTGIEEAQVINYLKMSGLDVGLLLNFGATRLQVQRFGWSRKRAEAAAAAEEMRSSAVSAPSADGVPGAAGQQMDSTPSAPAAALAR